MTTNEMPTMTAGARTPAASGSSVQRRRTRSAGIPLLSSSSFLHRWLGPLLWAAVGSTLLLPGMPDAWLPGAVAVLAGSLVLGLASRQWPAHPAWRLVGVEIALALVLLLVITTGGHGSPYHVVYLVVLSYAALTRSGRRLMVDGALVAGAWIVTEVTTGDGFSLVVAQDLAVHALAWGVGITIVHRLTAELSTSEHRFRSLFDNHPDGVHLSDRDGRLIAVNRSTSDMTGYDPDELAAALNLAGDAALQPGDDVSAPDPHLEAALQGHPQTFDTTIRHRDGHEVAIQRTYIPVIDDGRVVSVFSVSQDISDRVAAARAVQASERRFRLFAEQSQGLVYRLQVQPTLRYEYLNHATERVTGFAVSDFVQDANLPLRRVHPDDLDKLLHSRATAGEAGTALVRWQRPDGTWVWLEDRYTPINNDDGEVVAIQGTVFDVSAREEAKRRLQSALQHEHAAADRLRSINRMQSTFLQATSHELRTPLTSVLGIASTLRDHADRLPADRRTDLLDRLVGNARRLSGLLDDLLDVERLAAGEITVDRQPVELGALCEQTLTEVSVNAHHVDVDVGDTTVLADPRQLARIVSNLVRNAVKHTPHGTKVWVRGEPHADGTVLVVEDDGPGVPEELVGEIFEPFRQGPTAAHDASPGTGIGLTLVARFAQLNGGQAWVEQRAGGGARFCVLLPGA